jgi:hypothetical protein
MANLAFGSLSLPWSDRPYLRFTSPKPGVFLCHETQQETYSGDCPTQDAEGQDPPPNQEAQRRTFEGPLERDGQALEATTQTVKFLSERNLPIEKATLLFWSGLSFSFNCFGGPVLPQGSFDALVWVWV